MNGARRPREIEPIGRPQLNDLPDYVPPFREALSAPTPMPSGFKRRRWCRDTGLDIVNAAVNSLTVYGCHLNHRGLCSGIRVHGRQGQHGRRTPRTHE